MHPVLFSVGPVNIYSYGAIVAFGTAISALLIYRQAGRFNVDKDNAVDLIILMLLAGIAGARALHILLNLSFYLIRPLEMIDLSKGGLVWYGGFTAGLIAAVIFIKRKRLDFWAVIDLVMPYVALAQCLGRLGCFLNGCCYGVKADPGFGFGVVFPGMAEAVHPTQLYSALSLLIIYIVLRIWQELPHFKGEIALGYLALYSAKRFLIELMRGDNPRILCNLTLAQLISVIIFAVSAAIYLKKAIKWRKYLSSK